MLCIARGLKISSAANSFEGFAGDFLDELAEDDEADVGVDELFTWLGLRGRSQMRCQAFSGPSS